MTTSFRPIRPTSPPPGLQAATSIACRPLPRSAGSDTPIVPSAGLGPGTRRRPTGGARPTRPTPPRWPPPRTSSPRFARRRSGRSRAARGTTPRRGSRAARPVASGLVERPDQAGPDLGPDDHDDRQHGGEVDDQDRERRQRRDQRPERAAGRGRPRIGRRRRRRTRRRRRSGGRPCPPTISPRTQATTIAATGPSAPAITRSTIGPASLGLTSSR